MKLSKYTVTFPLKNGKEIVYSSLSHAVVEMEHGSLKDKDIELLRTLRIIHQNDDKEEMIKKLRKRKESDGQLAIWLYITMDCNMKCQYCYEATNENMRLSNTMSKETIFQFVQWCSNYVHQNKIQDIFLTITGGEPTLYLDNLEILVELLKRENLYSICKFSMISNGYGWSERTFLFIKDHMNSIQVTLDGAERIHNIRRIAKDGSKTFKPILRNLVRLVNDYKSLVVIRINIDRENVCYVDEVFEALEKYKLKNKVVVNIGDVLGEKITESYVFDKIIEIYDTQVKHGFEIVICETTPCPIANADWFVVDSRGKLYKCTGAIENEDMAIGSIFSEVCGYKIDGQESIESWQECLDCEVVGICVGGCEYRSKLNSVSGKKICRKKYLLEVLKRQVLSSWKREQSVCTNNSEKI